jgi:hypothetical protein
MTSTLRPSLSSKLSFMLVDLTISFCIKHLAVLLKVFHCITTCIANGAAARNSCAVVPTSLTTTSLRVASWSSGTFPIISLSVSSFSFIFMLFFNRCRFTMHPALVTYSRMSSTGRPEVVVPTPTSQTMAQLDFLHVFTM